MSLSRILNDDPVPVQNPRILHSALSARSSGERTFDDDHPLPVSDHDPPPSSRHRTTPLYHTDSSRSPRNYHPQPGPFQSSARDWDSYSGEWPRDQVPVSHGSPLYHDHQGSRYMSPDPPRPPPPFREPESETLTRKRRKNANDDSSYSSVAPRRGPPRKSSKRAKQLRGGSPTTDPNPNHYDVHQLADEGRHLVSSDLEDCEDIWKPELDEYMLQTKRHQLQFQEWFETTVIERNSMAAQRLSHHYATRVATIPLPPPSPPLPQICITPTGDGGMSPRENGRDHDEQGRLRDERRRRIDAEDAALELERSIFEDPACPFDESTLTTLSRRKGKTKARDPVKRTGPVAESDSGSDLEIPRKGDSSAPAHKKRKVDKDAASIADDIEKALVNDIPTITLKVGGFKVKGKGKQTREPSPDSLSATPKPARKRAAPKKKLGLASELEAELASYPPSAAGDATPAMSRPTSPAPTISSVVYELDELIPPLKKAKKVDDASMMKRVKSLEEAQRKVWTNIAKRDVAKVYRYMTLGFQARQAQLERTARTASIQARKPYMKNPKAQKDIQTKAKRLMREMQVLWKKNEKEERDVRKREQKEAMDRLKIEEEKREAARQARKLEFLISQTELYSHFVGSKLKTMEIEGDGEQIPVPAGAQAPDGDLAQLPDINFDDEDQTNLHRHARANAQEAITLAKQRAQQFDTQAALERKTNEALKLAKGQAHVRDNTDEDASGSSSVPLDLDSDELNFQNPTSLSNNLTIGQPKMLMAQLKEYQLKGLNWLATLYEQGINGILADEMGLGKTVQSISLLAYLAEAHDIWGPFLVVAPASTLHNWQQEITRFVPKLKALPYWGNVKDRMTLRKFWSKKEISYDEDAPFHVLITSYQLVTQDQQYFQRVKWQYMILDEAQNIKNSSSVRWRTLLGFHCRNRLLLTGTPIQNSMQELWALLHFIMPSLFDSHDEFNEWFSKDIENAAENKGSKLNEHQLRRLHMILKPFMLRRVKRHVQNELSEKIEKDIHVDLSARQRALYSALLANVSITDLLEKATNIGDADSARSLMNLVMQFRKVCNHPELFERADVVAPLSFSCFGQSGNLAREGDFLDLPYSVRNPIEVSVPDLFYQDGGFLDVPCETSVSKLHTSAITKLCNIWSADWMHDAVYDPDVFSFSFLPFLGLSPGEAHSLHTSPLMKRGLRAVEDEAQLNEIASYALDPDFAAYTKRNLRVLDKPPLLCLAKAENLPPLNEIALSSWNDTCLSRAALQWFIPPAVAPPVSIYCPDRSFLEQQERLLEGPLETFAFYGLPLRYRDSEEACKIYHGLVPALPPIGLVGTSPRNQVPAPKMQVPEAKRLIYDSAKLACLDSLLQELKEGGHRVLVYFQMTRMMDLMEEYLIYRQYKYLRLDGSSKLEDRRDMVIDWQTRSDIFVFLLSTRAGGLGINLTAADTVVFYDHDWNPSNDAQAMDRAHRLGQTRQVTVYRLITKGTIDERIVQLARVKKDVQDIVVGNKTFQDMAKPSEIVQLLLNDEQLANLDTHTTQNLSSSQLNGKAADGNVRDLWNEEGDDFFGHSGPITTNEQNDDDSGAMVVQSMKGRKRKTGAGNGRGRKSGHKKKDAAAAVAAAVDEMASN